MSAEPRVVGVGVPTNRDARLILCLDALAALLLPADVAIDVVIVDDGSPEPPPELVGRYPFARLVAPHRGSYAARNTGRQDPADFVLTGFARREQPEVELLVVHAADAVESIVTEGLEATRLRFHSRG